MLENHRSISVGTAHYQLLVGLLLLFTIGNAHPGPAPAPMGTIKLLVGTATVTRDGVSAPLSRGEAVYSGNVIETGARAFVRVEMADGTRFTIGKNAVASVDEFSFDEAAATGQFAATVVRGGFAYVSGRIGEIGGARQHSFISTSTAIIGIRGSSVKGQVDAAGNTVVILETGILEVSDAGVGTP